MVESAGSLHDQSYLHIGTARDPLSSSCAQLSVWLWICHQGMICAHQVGLHTSFKHMTITNDLASQQGRTSSKNTTTHMSSSIPSYLIRPSFTHVDSQMSQIVPFCLMVVPKTVATSVCQLDMSPGYDP